MYFSKKQPLNGVSWLETNSHNSFEFLFYISNLFIFHIKNKGRSTSANFIQPFSIYRHLHKCAWKHLTSGYYRHQVVKIIARLANVIDEYSAGVGIHINSSLTFSGWNELFANKALDAKDNDFLPPGPSNDTMESEKKISQYDKLHIPISANYYRLSLTHNNNQE